MVLTEAPINEFHSEGLKAELLSAVSQSGPFEEETEAEYEARAPKRDKIVKQLPDNITELILEDIAHSEDIVEKKGKTLTKEQKQMITRGTLFQTLVDIEMTTDDSEMDSPTSRQILEAFKNPPQILVDAIHYGRNPDLIKIHENSETGALVITGLTETKLGKLNLRAFEQLSHFRDSLTDLIETLKELKKTNVALVGFEELVNSSDKLQISDKLDIAIVMPADRETRYFHQYVNYDDFVRENDLDAYEQLTEEILPECVFPKSKISKEDILAMEDVLKPHLGFY